MTDLVLLGPHNHMTQFLIINLFLCIYIYPIGFVSLDNPDYHTVIGPSQLHPLRPPWLGLSPFLSQQNLSSGGPLQALSPTISHCVKHDDKMTKTFSRKRASCSLTEATVSVRESRVRSYSFCFYGMSPNLCWAGSPFPVFESRHLRSQYRLRGGAEPLRAGHSWILFHLGWTVSLLPSTSLTDGLRQQHWGKRV